MNPCPPGALCHSRIENITQQLRDTAVQRDLGQSTLHQLSQKYDKLSQQNIHLSQDYNVIAEHRRRGDAAYRELEKAFRQVQISLSGAVQDCQNMHARLEQQRILVQQSDARLDHILSTTKMLGQSLYFLTIDKSDLPDDQKRQQKGLDYAEVQIERDLLRVERDELKTALAKERERTASGDLGPMQLKGNWSD